MEPWKLYGGIAIVIVITVAIVTRYMLKRVQVKREQVKREGFQDADILYDIMYPDPDKDEEQVEIPRPLAVRAYQLLGPSGPTVLFGPSGPLGASAPTYPSGALGFSTATNPSGAQIWSGYPSGPRLSSPARIRELLLSDLGFYTELLNRTSVPQVARNTTWDTDPKAAACREFGLLADKFTAMLTELRPKLLDISGATGEYGRLKDKNMDYQRELQAQCKRNLSSACEQLARLDESILSIMPEFEKTNDELILQSINLTEQYQVVDKLRDIMQCPRANASWSANVSGASGPLGFNPDLTFSRNLGIIDTQTMRLKLAELSPYYISPAVLNYVTEYLLKEDEMEQKVNTTKDLVTEMSQTTDRIRVL